MPASAKAAGRETRLDGSAAAEAAANGALLIDVRGDVARRRDGVLVGATVVAKTALIAALSPGSPTRLRGERGSIILFCSSENGTGPLMSVLAGAGYDDIFDVAGGFPALKAAGLPTRPYEDDPANS